MRVEGKFTPYTIQSAYSEFEVVVVHQCYLTELLPKIIRSPIIFNLDYPSAQPEIVRFREWTETLGFCEPIVYRA